MVSSSFQYSAGGRLVMRHNCRSCMYHGRAGHIGQKRIPCPYKFGVMQQICTLDVCLGAENRYMLFNLPHSTDMASGPLSVVATHSVKSSFVL